MSVETIENNVGEIMMENNNNNYVDSQFPDGMRVLVVDDSRVCLKYVTLLLQKCRFQVTAKENSGEALMLLKQNEDNFDIVLTNVRMHEVDGFKLLEAGLEHDIPVIMISANDDLEIIKKGVRHGAVDYLVKPVSLGEIKNIWQHVYRKNLCFVSPRDCIDAPSNKGGTKRSRRKSTSNIRVDNYMESASKRERVRWTPALHTKFVDSVAKLGGVDNAVPKKILEMMGEKDVTREKVASHLQKYRKAIKENLMVDRDGGGGKKVRKNKINSNTSSESHIVDPETMKGTYSFDRSHPTIASNATVEVLASAQPTFTMHQRPQFATNGWMFNNSFSQPSPMQQVRQTHQLVQQPNIPFDRAFVRPNNIAIPVVNHPGHPHPQPCQPSFGNVRSYYSDPHHQHMSYGTVRSSEEFEDMFFSDVPPVSGNGSLLDIVLANESFFDE